MSKTFGPVPFFEKPIPLPKMVRVWDQQPQKRDPELDRKLARVVALLEELVGETHPAVDVMAEKRKQKQENARRLRERNARQKQYETPEDRVTVPARFLQDALRQAAYEEVCRRAEKSYSARNPHKPRQRAEWETRLATRDSESRFMTACEQAQAAYAARNPHKR